MSSDVAELERPIAGLPANWTEVTLGDIVSLEYGKSLPDKSRRPGTVPVYGSNGVVGWHDEPLVTTGGIIVGRKGTAGSVTVSTDPFWPIDTTYFVKARQTLDWDWLAATLQHARLNELNEATGVPGLNRDKAYRQNILLPPLDEQRRIAEVLRSVDEAIAAADAVAASMLRACKTMRHELLNVAPDGTISDLPSGWTVLPLEELASVDRGKFSIRPRNDPRYFGGSMPFIQTGDITAAGDYITHHSQTLNDLGVGVSRVFPAGTIMTTIAANIGDFAIASYPVACPDSVVGISANPNVDQFWLYSVLSCFKAALDRAATQNAQKNINLQTLRPLQVPVPPRALMFELAETLSAAADGARQAKASVVSLTAMKQAIMADLLSGRVRVPA